ncbi:hypothetical protein FH508_0014895 [Lysinibacillus sp. CD3-6]|uniref:hypothetical protein n=1 Tax=Lysinibacillus sp. CD3-6 TaxID=2892541 RepID=UPI00116F48EA|nr:hypothetical protein [Lysinibacillus sp. CD3-6]UED78739.1 hypothetical protein FH508_0014895 [Lysinibacillus sp. CD3-6]
MKELHINDPAISECWDRLVIEFTNEFDTIEFLNSCSEEEVYWISSVFDDLAYKFPSRKYLDCIKQLAKKYPEIDMAHDIELAESYIL